MNLLKAKNISHHFDYQLFNNVSLELNSSKSIAIIGKSGSGKSTLLNILSTFLKPDKGYIEILSNDISKISNKKLSEIRRKVLGIVFQQHYLFKGFSGLENLEVSSILSNQKIDEDLLSKLGIKDVVHQKVTELSGGQQQRVSIARVLTKKPKIIFADEPTGNLDKDTANDVMDIFFEYIKQNQSGLIIVTHDRDLAYRCDEVYKLENKEIHLQKC